jgi:hypothetical protein
VKIMKIPDVLGLGFRVTRKNGEQQALPRNNMTYATPYQIAYEGLLVKTDALSTAYDATATPTQCVAIPSTYGGYVDGWAYISTKKPHPLPGGANITYPLTANLGGNSYATSAANWTEITVAPLIPGDLVGMPMAAATTVTWGSEICSASCGYIQIATSGHWVIGKAEWPADNTSGASGAVTASVRICHQYKKA